MHVSTFGGGVFCYDCYCQSLQTRHAVVAGKILAISHAHFMFGQRDWIHPQNIPKVFCR